MSILSIGDQWGLWFPELNSIQLTRLRRMVVVERIEELDGVRAAIKAEVYDKRIKELRAKL